MIDTIKSIFIFIITSLIVSSTALGQYCITDEVGKSNGNIHYKNGNITVPKIVRLSIHFILKDDGSGNFTIYDDGQGNTRLRGYDFAQEMVDITNDPAKQVAMNIPPNNTTPVLPRNIKFIIDGVYFHHNTSQYDFYTSNDAYTSHKVNTDSTLQVYFTVLTPNSTAGSGYASNIDEFNKNKYTEVALDYTRYSNFVNGTNTDPDYYSWIIHSIWHTFAHEIFHLLGLSHTVLYNGGTIYPISLNGDPDGCIDTPSPWEMINIYGFSNIPLYHPGKTPVCGWNTANVSGCSNNWMDYNSGTALTPCQLTKMHGFLEGGMQSYSGCAGTSNDIVITDLGHPKRTHFGKNITIKSNIPNVIPIKIIKTKCTKPQRIL